MTMDGNSSSGSSVDPGELPAKRPRTSTVVTRGSKVTTSRQTTVVVTGQNSHTPSISTDADVAVEGANTNDAGEMAVEPVHTLTPPPLSPSPMDIRQNAQISDTTTPPHAQQATDTRLDADTDTPPDADNDTPPDADTESSSPSSGLHLNAKPKVPEVLTGAKNNIYDYLDDVNEPRFKALLTHYIAFELADLSGIRGALPTENRPKSVGWWSSRARPNKIPPYDSLSSFTNNIIGWWISIQPDWRTLKRGKTSRAKGDFICLYQPGINGLLNIVILVFWWASILEDRNEPVDETYLWFVTDVTWVLSQLTRVANAGFGS